MNISEIKELINSNSNINIQDKNGMTPLMVAIDFKDLSLVKKLIELKAKLDLQDKYYNGPVNLDNNDGLIV
jgi:ankyrin repeat protein